MSYSGAATIASAINVWVQSDPAGILDTPGPRNPYILVHSGPSVHIGCNRGGRSYSGLSVHGDVDIVPAGVPSRWELKEKDTALIISVSQQLLRTVAEECDRRFSSVDLINRFQVRDAEIERIGWALQIEDGTGNRHGGLYRESLVTGLAIHLLRNHCADQHTPANRKGGMPGKRLKEVISYIEDNLRNDLSLAEIAAVAGMSVSHCKTQFRESVGKPIHQYVIERRVDRARALLCNGTLPTSRIAQDMGFAHQSHLAYHVRRRFGVSPKALRGI